MSLQSACSAFSPRDCTEENFISLHNKTVAVSEKVKELKTWIFIGNCPYLNLLECILCHCSCFNILHKLNYFTFEQWQHHSRLLFEILTHNYCTNAFLGEEVVFYIFYFGDLILTISHQNKKMKLPTYMYFKPEIFQLNYLYSSFSSLWFVEGILGFRIVTICTAYQKRIYLKLPIYSGSSCIYYNQTSFSALLPKYQWFIIFKKY